MSKSSIIAVTGYMGTGSSAVIDLLREYDTVKVVPEIGHTYEHVPFYFRGGLFDLYNALLHGNTPMGSDATINRFIASMRTLNDNKFIWCGTYKELFDDLFIKINNDFISSISTEFHALNVNHYIETSFSVSKYLRQMGSKLVRGRKIEHPGIKIVLDNNHSYFGLPTKEELDIAAKNYTSSYFALFTANREGYYIFDHLVLPQQIDVFADCFEKDVKFIVVTRDPRDVFLMNKYIWYTPPIGHGKPYFPTDPESFVNLWKRMVISNYTISNCLIVRFEDLVYQYSKTVESIEKFLGVEAKKHVYPLTELIPDKSIENTQVFNVNEEWKKEVSVIEKELTQYLYDFPYSRKPNRNGMFDK